MTRMKPCQNTSQRRLAGRREATCRDATAKSKNTLLMARSEQVNISISSAS